MKKSKNPLNLGLSRKGKKFIASNPRLLTISENERQLLLNERVASILENAHKFEDHYYVYNGEDKIDFSDIPRRLQKFRDLECSLWTKAASPFEPEEETKFLQQLNASNQLKQCVTRLPVIRPSSEQKRKDDEMAKSSCSVSRISHYAESQNEDSQELFENSDPEDNDDSNPLKEMANQSQTQSEKKLFPIFSLSQKKKEAEDTNTASSSPAVAGCSIMSNVSSDFDTPKANRNPVIQPKKLSAEMKTSVEENLSKSRSSIPTERKSESVGWKPPPLSMSTHKDLAQDLLSLFLEKIDADITVYGREEKPIRAHKLILKARCPRLLKDIVTEKSSKSKSKEVIPLTCFSHTAVKSLMSYIYCGRILPPGFKISDLRERDLEEIKELGKKYGLDLSPPSPTSIRTEKVAKPPAKDVKEMDTQTTSIELNEKAVQTDTAEDLEFAREEERLNSLREDERSREYHCDSHLSYQGAYRPVFQRSPDLFEGSFNDRVFAHSLERSAAKKRRRSWSENRRMSVTESDSSESIILLDDDDDGDIIRKTPEEQYVQELEPEPIEPEPESKSESNHIQLVEDKVDDMFDDCPRSPWGRTYDDDAFFANLPADEELLDIPPTSPIGAKTYNSPFVPSPVRPTYQSPLTHKSPVKKAPAKRRPRNGKAAAGEKRLKTGRGRGKSSQVERSGEDDDMDSDSECANGISNGGYRSPRISASQGGGGVSSSQNVASKNQSTPMLNYSLIDTPILKRELKRYGLKPLPRSKAKVLLRHIYKETHK